MNRPAVHPMRLLVPPIQFNNPSKNALFSHSQYISHLRTHNITIPVFLYLFIYPPLDWQKVLVVVVVVVVVSGSEK